MSYTVPPRPLASVHRLDDHRTALAPDPATDPGEVWAEVLAAARLFGALREAGMSVRFDTEDPAYPPRVRITDLSGRVVREVAPALACDPEALEAELLSA